MKRQRIKIVSALVIGTLLVQVLQPASAVVFAEESNNTEQVNDSSVLEGSEANVTEESKGNVENNEIFIPDMKLETAIRNRLGIYNRELTTEDMKNLTTLNIKKSGVKDLTGLEYAIALEDLDISENGIGDISALKDLANLKILKAANNKISDITPLANLNMIYYLDLNNNEITSIDAMENLTNLDYLYLDNNGIVDIKPITNCTSIGYISMNNNKVQDISSINNFSEAVNIDIRDNNITNIGNFSEMPYLDRLSLSGNKITDISGLKNLTSLTTLFLEGNSISDISVLSNMTKLTRLFLSNNNIKDIYPIAGLANIYELSIGNNGLSNIENISELKKLTNLDLSYNNISDITALSQLTSLRILSLDENKITEVSNLTNLVRLEQLYLNRNMIIDISPLKNLERLLKNKGLHISSVITLEQEDVENGKGIEFIIPEFIDIDGQPVNIYNASFNGTVYGVTERKVTIPTITENGEVTIEFNQGRYNDNNFSGIINKTINVTRKEISDVFDFKGIVVDKTTIVKNDYFNLTLDIRVKDESNKIKNIVSRYRDEVQGYEQEIYFTLEEDKFVSKDNLAHSLGKYSLMYIDIEMENGEKYHISRDDVFDLSQGDYAVEAGLENVNIPDVNLQDHLRKRLGLAEGDFISESNLKTITSLDLYSFNVKDFTGLEYATNLKELRLLGNSKINVESLGRLKSLTKLTIDNFSIDNYDFLSSLSNLKYLSLYNSKINDLNPLQNLFDLEELNLGGGNISSIEPLRELTKLKVLHLGYNNISSIQGIENLVNLETLDLTANKIGDITNLSELSNIRELSLGDNNITDIKALTQLTNIKVLDLRTNKIKEIDYLSNLINIEELNLDNNEIVNLDPISNMNVLKTLSLYSNKVTNLNSLENLKMLETLNISEIKTLENINGLGGLTSLGNLTMSGCNITDIAPLANLVNLEYLIASTNKIEDIAPLSSLKKLRSVELTENNITDMEPVTNLINLEFLSLNSNKITTIPEDIKNLRKLRSASVQHQEIKNLPVETMGELLVDNPMYIFGENVKPDYVSNGGEAIDNKVYWENVFTSGLMPYFTVDRRIWTGVVSLNFSCRIFQPVEKIVSDVPPTIKADYIETKLWEEFDPLYDVIATDNENNNISDRIEVIENTVDIEKIGKYKIVYRVTDKYGNTTTKERVVSVILDNPFKLDSFVVSIYNIALNRKPDAEGYKYWTDALKNRNCGGRWILINLLSEPEFKDLNLGAEDYVSRMYTVIVGREPDAEGFKYWVDMYNDYIDNRGVSVGATRMALLSYMIKEPEFRSRCINMGIDY